MGHNHPFNMAGDPTASKHTPWVFQDDVVNPARFASESNRLVKCWSAVTDCCWKKQVQYMLHMMSSWWFQPFWKILVKFGSFPKVCVKISNIWNHYLNAYWIIIWGLFLGPKGFGACWYGVELKKSPPASDTTIFIYDAEDYISDLFRVSAVRCGSPLPFKCKRNKAPNKIILVFENSQKNKGNLSRFYTSPTLYLKRNHVIAIVLRSPVGFLTLLFQEPSHPMCLCFAASKAVR